MAMDTPDTAGWKADICNDCRADDLIPEESETVQLALKRLSPKEAYDRVFRMRRAFQVQHTRPGLEVKNLGNEYADLVY